MAIKSVLLPPIDKNFIIFDLIKQKTKNTFKFVFIRVHYKLESHISWRDLPIGLLIAEIRQFAEITFFIRLRNVSLPTITVFVLTIKKMN